MANNQNTTVVEYRNIKIDTSYSLQVFQNIWYIPEFGNIYLLSVSELNQAKIRVSFENGIVIIYNQETIRTLFQSIGKDSLFTLETKLQNNKLLLA